MRPATSRACFKPGAGSGDHYVFFDDGTFAWSNSEATIHEVIDRQAGARTGLGFDADLRPAPARLAQTRAGQPVRRPQRGQPGGDRHPARDLARAPLLQQGGAVLLPGGRRRPVSPSSGATGSSSTRTTSSTRPGSPPGWPPGWLARRRSRPGRSPIPSGFGVISARFDFAAALRAVRAPGRTRRPDRLGVRRAGRAGVGPRPDASTTSSPRSNRTS